MGKSKIDTVEHNGKIYQNLQNYGGKGIDKLGELCSIMGESGKKW